MIPFQLDKGIFLEDINELIPWGTPEEELANYGSPIAEVSYFRWENHVCLGGLHCSIGAVFSHDTIGYDTNIGTLQHVTLHTRERTIDYNADSDYRLTKDHLDRVLGSPSFHTGSARYTGKPQDEWRFSSTVVKLGIYDIKAYVCFLRVSHAVSER